MTTTTQTTIENFNLKFGKYKGQDFLSTPKSYQEWLLAQDWFKTPTTLTPQQQASKKISELSSNLKGWNGYSKKGAAIYDALFEAEKAEEDAYFNDSGIFSSRYDGSW